MASVMNTMHKESQKRLALSGIYKGGFTLFRDKGLNNFDKIGFHSFTP
jgi:hypothetical protein